MEIEKPFCIFREPENEIKCIRNQKVNVFESFDEIPEKAFFVSRFTGGGYYLEGAPNSSESFNWNFTLPENNGIENSSDKASYEQKVHAALEEVLHDRIEKVVLSRCSVIPLKDGLHFKQIFHTLCEQYPNAFIYLLHLNGQVWLGATPEVLISRDGNEIESLSLAGTIRNEDKQAFSPKEEYEQMVVTSYILHKMSGFTDALKMNGPQKLNAGRVSHLATRITGRLKHEDEFGALVDALHPTPAVCGLPESLAMDFISEQEGYDRDFYTGYIGYQAESNSRLYVNLRCAQLFADAAVLYAGGGIVEGSEPEKEWEETVEKMKTMGQLLSES